MIRIMQFDEYKSLLRCLVPRVRKQTPWMHTSAVMVEVAEVAVVVAAAIVIMIVIMTLEVETKVEPVKLRGLFDRMRKLLSFSIRCNLLALEVLEVEVLVLKVMDSYIERPLLVRCPFIILTLLVFSCNQYRILGRPKNVEDLYRYKVPKTKNTMQKKQNL